MRGLLVAWLLLAADAEPAEVRARFVEHYSYRVEWSGLRFYFTGDTQDTSELLRQRDLDAAFVSPWLLDSVARQGQRIDARRVVVYHQTSDEVVPGVLGRELPRQGDELVFRSQ